MAKAKSTKAKKAKAGGSKAKKAPAKAKVRTATHVAKPKPGGKDVKLKKLRATAADAEKGLKAAEVKAEKLRQEADTLVRSARNAFVTAIAPYKAACKKVKVTCEYKAKRGPVTERVRFLVTKVDKGVKVGIKGKPKTAEILDAKVLRKSIMKAAASYCEKHIGPRSEIGAKHAGLYNRIRKVLGKMK